MANKWKMDPSKVYNVPMCYSFKEMRFKWFHRKVCPKCGSKLDYTPYEEATGKKARLGGYDSAPGFSGLRDEYNYWYYYTCPKCGGYYSLEELVEAHEERKGNKKE